MQPLGNFVIFYLAAVPFVFAGPPPRAPQIRGRASLTAVPNKNYHNNGILAYAKVLQKYGATLPDNLAAAVAKVASRSAVAPLESRGTGSVKVTPEIGDSKYLIPVNVGTPVQQLMVVMDSGSADFFVCSTLQEKTEVVGKVIYDAKQSSSAHPMEGATWNVEYVNGDKASGIVVTDTVTVGGVTVANQAVQLAKTVSGSLLQDSHFDGLMGFAMSSRNNVQPKQQQTFFDNAKAGLDAPLVTADLKHNANGTFNFGYIDNKAFKGSMLYTPIADPPDNTEVVGLWNFKSPGYAIGTQKGITREIAAFADTGTTLLLLPEDVVNAYYHEVKGAHHSDELAAWIFPCDAKLPDFSYMIGPQNGMIQIPGSYLLYAAVPEGVGSQDSCYGAMQSAQPLNTSVFGDVALKAAFVVFDYGKKQLGFASKELPP